MAGGTVTATWSGTASRQPENDVAGFPPLAPLAISVANTAGQWLFAVVSWRQDALSSAVAQTGISYPSTVNISDDAGNLWVPVCSQPASTGVVRTTVWMAPAAQAADYVFISPTGYQAGLAALILEVTADCPWYSVSDVATNYSNNPSGGAVSVTQGITTTGLFSVGVASYNVSSSPTITHTGWTASTVVTATNGVDNTGDVVQHAYYATTAGSALSLAISGGVGTTSYSAEIITVHGVTDVLAFPYTQPTVENWPSLVTQIAAGPVLNANPDFVNGTSDWTGQNATVAEVTWPAYQPWPNYQSLITPSLSITPSGSATFANCLSEQEAVSPVQLYTALAWVYSAAGYDEVNVVINWYTSGASYINTSGGPYANVLAGTWTELSFADPVFPPPTAAFGQVGVQLTALSGDVPSSAVMYVGYCGFGPADAYEDTPQDQLAWTDLSSRNFSQGSISIERGIQYEQQSLEAGTMTVYLDNDDGEMMFGNILSSYWPTIGDTDVPIRLLAVWPESLTPYYMLYSGFTDQIEFGWDEDEGTWYGYASVQAADAWSRLTSQLLGAAEQEILEDNPVVYCPCNQSGTNIAPGNSNPVATLTGNTGAATAVATFTSNAFTLVGDSGVSCWQSTGLTSANIGGDGVALGYFPANGEALTMANSNGGYTLEFWVSPQSVSTSQPTGTLTVAAAVSRRGLLWAITINNNSGAASSTASITTYDQYTQAGTTTSLGGVTFLGTDSAPSPFFFSVTFAANFVNVIFNPGTPTATTGGAFVTGLDMPATIVGFSFGGIAGPIAAYNTGGNGGFMNLAVYGVALFAYQLPVDRRSMHYLTAYSAWPSELDTSRLARITGYAGATPVILGMRCQDLGTAPAADLDPVTAVTDTYGQVSSDYFTNIAASTLAGMFVNGAGTLIYRRRLDWYDRAAGQWALGELAQVPVNANTLNNQATTAGWNTSAGTTLTIGSLPAVSPAFSPYAGLMTGNGSVAPSVYTGSLSGTPVTPGLWYQASALMCSPQGWASSGTITLNWFTSGGSSISSTSFTTASFPAGSLVYGVAGPLQAPATAAYAQIQITATGTPASTVHFYIANAELVLVPAAAAGGIAGIAAEVPYLPAVTLSNDRALLYNQAILTQYGTDTQVTYTGPSLVFTPTSGILVTIQNTASVTQRAGVPYTATIYLNNTAQAVPYYLNEGSIEDFGNWITQTLAAPLLRPETVTVTPAATPQAMLMALGAEIGDTVTFRRRPQTGGAPEIQIVTYISKLSHSINIATGQWDVQYELSPFPAGSVLACDDVIHGTLTGGNWLGW